MADTGKQSPLGVNVLGSLLQNQGFYINPTAQSFMGVSKSTQGDYTPGKLVNDTCLKWLAYATSDAYRRGQPAQNTPYTVDNDTYNNLVTIGQSRIPALGNSPPNTWETTDPSGIWKNLDPNVYPDAVAGAPATSGYGFANLTGPTDPTKPPLYVDQQLAYVDEGQSASWYPFLASVPIEAGEFVAGTTYTIKFIGTTDFTKWGAASNTVGISFVATGAGFGTGIANTLVPNAGITQWGWIRCMALQAWNEFNWNGENTSQENNTPTGSPAYKDFVDSFMTTSGFKNYSNEAIFAIQDSQEFLQGTYSNQNDLISADVSGVSLSSRAFGQDLINLGNALDLSTIGRFGLPSTLLQNLQKNKALTQPVILSLLTAGLSQSQITEIAAGNITPTTDQEQKIYGAFLVVVGRDLLDILITLNCKTKNLTKLADLLSVKNMFPLSYTTLTVPIYNTNPGPTNSKTYYLLFVKQELNPQLVIPRIKEIVGTITPPVPPPVLEEPIVPPLPVIEEKVIEQPAPPIIPSPPVPAPEPYIPPPAPNPEVPIGPAPPPTPPTGPDIGGGGGCVALESYVPMVEIEKKHNGREVTKAWMLESGMKISLGTDDIQIVDGQVVKTLNDYQPCIRITTVEGISLVCSTTARILTKENGFTISTELFGKRVAVMRNGRTWYDEVIRLEDAGMKFVRVIDAGNNSFWAGEKPGSYILHHNVPINEDHNVAKH